MLCISHVIAMAEFEGWPEVAKTVQKITRLPYHDLDKQSGKICISMIAWARAIITATWSQAVSDNSIGRVQLL